MSQQVGPLPLYAQPNCTNCPFSDIGQARNPVPGEGPAAPKWIAIGEGPGMVEVDRKKPFQGPSGDLLNKSLSIAGVDRTDVLVTNATMCLPTRNATDGQKKAARDCCAPRLKAELAQHPGLPVLALGGVAAQGLLGDKFSIMQMAGSAFRVDVDGTGERDVIPTVHPAAILRGGGEARGGTHVVDLLYWNLTYDIAKVAGLANGKRIRFSEDIFYEYLDPQRAHELVLKIAESARRLGYVACDTETYVAPTIKELEETRWMLQAVGLDVQVNDIAKTHSALQPQRAKLSALGLATEEFAVSVAWTTPAPDRKPFVLPETVAVIRDLLGDAQLTKEFHNGIYDRPVLKAHGLEVRGPIEDTLLRHHSTFPGASHNLQKVGTQFFVITPWKSEYRVEKKAKTGKKTPATPKRDKWDVTVETIEDHLKYNAKDTLVTARIRKPLASMLPRLKGEDTYRVDKFCADLAVRMGEVGVPISLEVNKQLRERFRADLKRAYETLNARVNDPAVREEMLDNIAYEQAKTKRKGESEDFSERHAMRLMRLKGEMLNKKGKPVGKPFQFNLHVSDHIIGYLKARNVPLYVQTEKGKLSTKKDVLENLSHLPEVRAIIEVREAEKMLATFVDKVAKSIYADGRIRARWSVHKLTGRWGAEDPQLMNWPKANTKKNRPNLRSQVVAPNRKKFVGFDFSQLEARLIALLSGDPFLVDIFAKNKDIHSEFARVVWPTFDQMEPKQRKELRDMIKRPEYCVAPGTRVLCSDLRWRAIEDLRPGDSLIGFDAAEPDQSWRENYLQPSVVEGVKPLKQVCYRVVTSQGELIASDEHLWVGQPWGYGRWNSKRWLRTDQLRVGDRLCFTTAPWQEERTYESGYVAGMFDGEGWLSAKGVGFAQNPGAVLDQVQSFLRARDFDLRAYGQKEERIVRCELGGGIWESLRLLGTMRPARLTPRADSIWVGRRLRSRGDGAEILAVERLGVRDVIALQTSTRTFVAEGFLSHNCAFYGGSIETGWKAVVKDYPKVKLIDIGRMVRLMTERMPLVTAWQQAQIRKIVTAGEVRSVIFGRRRAFPLNQGSPNEAINFSVQATAADIMAVGLMRAMPEIWALGGELILQIHDACVFECDEDTANEIAEIVKLSFTQDHEHNGVKVHFPIEVDIGDSWAEV